jgi:ketosteroid isomerase-like protein
LNDETLEGERVLGAGKAMDAPYPGRVTAELDQGRRSTPYARTVADPTDDLLEANAAFYAAFEEQDLDKMSEAWLHEDHVVCTHPGWASLRGWPAVAASWFALFQGDNSMQFILTNVEATVRGDIGWVTLDENLIAGAQAQSVAAMNLFERVEGRWRLVVHLGSGIAAG